MSEERERGEVLFGVSLEDLAAVHAAERAGVPKDERLDELGLDRAVFARAEQAWSERLATSLRDEPSLFVAYDMALAAALESDAPRILPLEEDLGAWIAFEGHFQRAADPSELVKRAGLTLLEVARLHRSWAAKLAADPALAAETAAKRAEEPLPLPEIGREPRRRPVCKPARVVVAPADLPATVSPAPIEPPPPVLAPSLMEPPAMSWNAGPVEPPVPPRAGALPYARAETMELSSLLVSLPAVPFAGRAPAEEAVERAKEQAAKVQPESSAGDALLAAGETAPIDVGAIARKVLAFDAAKSPAAALPATQMAPATPRAGAPPAMAPGETAPIDIGAIARNVLAFDSAKPASPYATAPLPPAAKPSSQRAAPAPPSRTEGSPTVPVPVPAGPETQPIDVRALARSVLGFEAPKPPSPALPGLPFSIEEVAAISAELSLHPENSAAIWARAGVRDSRAAAAIMAQVNVRLNSDAAFRQAWQKAYEAHRARLAGSRR